MAWSAHLTSASSELPWFGQTEMPTLAPMVAVIFPSLKGAPRRLDDPVANPHRRTFFRFGQGQGVVRHGVEFDLDGGLLQSDGA